MCCTAAYLYANFSVVLVQTNLLSANLHQEYLHQGCPHWRLVCDPRVLDRGKFCCSTSATEAEGGSFRQIERNSGPPPSSHVVWAPRNIGLRAPSELRPPARDAPPSHPRPLPARGGSRGHGRREGRPRAERAVGAPTQLVRHRT